LGGGVEVGIRCGVHFWISRPRISSSEVLSEKNKHGKISKRGRPLVFEVGFWAERGSRNKICWSFIGNCT